MPYDDVSDHLTILRDSIRTRAYERAIDEAAQLGNRVLDFGCGSGILSLFAARAGALRVIANGYEQIESIQESGRNRRLMTKSISSCPSGWGTSFFGSGC